MRIDEIAVDGFGLLRGYSVAPARGLTVFRGENEAGKTTLMAFIRAILFGFESKAYPALAGGRRGGRLTISLADGAVRRIERYGTFDTGGRGQLRVRDDRDVELDAAALERLLQGVDRGVFTNVFAFGLGELASFDTLKSADVAARIYGAGLGTGGVSALDAEKALQAECDGLFRSGGEKQRINEILSRLEEVDGRLAKLDLPAEYGAAQRRLRELEAQLQSLRRDDERLGTEERRLERLVQGWPAWLGLREARGELATLPEPPALPPDARDRLVRLDQARTAATEQHERAARLAEQARTAAAAVAVDERLLEARERIEPVLEAEREARARGRELEELRRERAAARDRADERLRRIGSTWDDERLLAFDDSLATHAAITRHRAALERATRETEQATAVAAGNDRDRTALDAEILAVGERIKALAEDDARPAAETGELDRRLRQLETAQVRHESLAMAVAAIDAGAPSAPAAPAGRSTRFRLLAGMAAATGITAGAIMLAAGVGPVPAGLVSVGGLVIAALLLMAGSSTAPLTDGSARSARTERLRAELAELGRMVADSAAALGIPAHPTEGDLGRVRAAIDRAREREGARGGLESQRATLVERRTRLEQRAAEAREAVTTAAAASNAARDAWAAWLAERALDPSLDPEGASRVVDGVTNAKDQVRSADALDTRIARLEAADAARIARALSVLESVGRRPLTASDLPAALGTLRADFDRTLAAEADRRQAQERADRLAVEEREARDRLGAASRSWDDFLRSCGAEDAEAVRRALALGEQRSLVEKRIATGIAALTALSGPDAALARFLAELEAVTDIGETRDRLAAVSTEREVVRVRHSDVDREYGALGKDAARMEHAVEATVDRQRSADLASTLKDHAERWTVRTLALAILRRTRERYEREHQPDVVRIAERLVADWSAGRYVRIIAPLGGQIEELERSDGTRVPLAGLSTGTAQQLYLALRFGLAEHFATAGEALPIVMDDILVNFDEARAQRAARSIEDLATRHQVLYFTCHPATPLRADLEVPLAPLVPVPVAVPATA